MGGGKKILMSELTSLRSKVLEQRTWSLKAWQQIQTLASQRLDLQQKLDLFKEERALKEEDERNNVPRQELAQRTDMLRELLWMAVKENKALATSEALRIEAGERQEYLERMSLILQAASLSQGSEGSMEPNMALLSCNDALFACMQALKNARFRARHLEARTKALTADLDAASADVQRLRKAVDLRGHVAVEARDQLRLLLDERKQDSPTYVPLDSWTAGAAGSEGRGTRGSGCFRRLK